MLRFWGKKPEKRALRFDGLGNAPSFSTPFTPYSENAARANGVVGACLRYSLDNIVEPSLRYLEGKGEDQAVKQNAFLDDLLALPWGPESAEYRIDWNRCLQIWAEGLNLDGNAYAIKGRSAGGRFTGLLPVSHIDVQVRTDRRGSRVVSYQVGATSYEPSDIVHISRGIDHATPALGCSPLKSAMRAVLTDNEIQAFQHRIVQSPTPGLAFMVPGDAPEAAVEQIREVLEARFGRENQGKVAVMQGDYKLERIGFSPADLAIDKLAKLPEERITAAFGIPAIVVGVGAGLERTTYNNMQEAYRAAARNHLSPLWNAIETALTQALLPEWGIDTSKAMLKFDRMEVTALREDLNDLAKRTALLFQQNVIDRATAKTMMGMDASDADQELYAWMLSAGAPMLPFDGSTSVKDRANV